MGPQTDLNLFMERAATVQMMISEITDMAEAFGYAATLTRKQGGESMAAFGWHGPDRSILEDVCRRVGLNLVGDNLQEHAANLHTALPYKQNNIAMGDAVRATLDICDYLMKD